MEQVRAVVKKYGKVYLIAVILAVICDTIGTVNINIGIGTLTLFPMVFAVIFGGCLGPDALKLFGIDRMNVDKYRLSFRRSASVNITDARAVPERFIQRAVTFDKAAIKAAIKSGETVDGAEITETQNLQIR